MTKKSNVADNGSWSIIQRIVRDRFQIATTEMLNDRMNNLVDTDKLCFYNIKNSNKTPAADTEFIPVKNLDFSYDGKMGWI